MTNISICSLFISRRQEAKLTATLLAEPSTFSQIVSRESKPFNSDFYQNNFLSTWEYQMHGAHSVEFS